MKKHRIALITFAILFAVFGGAAVFMNGCASRTTTVDSADFSSATDISSDEPSTGEPTTEEPTTEEPTTEEPTTEEPTTEEPTLIQAEAETAAITLGELGYSDIPQIHIYTDTELTREYSSASVTIYDPSGTYATADKIPIQIKVRGNTSSYCDKKPYTVKFSEKVSVLGMIKGKKWILLANRYDKTLMRSKLVFDFADRLSFAYNIDTMYVDVWLNGSYKGNYLLTTPVDVASNKVDIDIENNEFLIERELTRWEAGATYITTPLNNVRYLVNEPENITAEQKEVLLGYLGAAEQAIADKNYEKIERLIDVDTFIDFYIVHELFKNMDVNFSSSRLYIKEGKLYAGPLWDFDICCGNGHPYIYGAYGNVTNAVFALNTPWIKELLLVPEFKERFVARYNELQGLIVNLYEDNELGDNRIKVLQSRYGAALLRDSKVAGWWFVSMGLDETPFQSYPEYVDYLRTWLKARNEWLLQYLNAL